jgi:hypothetical protein
MTSPTRECEARCPTCEGYPLECNGPPEFDVVFRTEDRGRILLMVPACMIHALAEVDRTRRGAAQVDVGWGT